MADRKITAFTVTTVGDEVHLDFKSDRIKPFTFRMWADDNQPDLALIAKTLTDGFTAAVEHGWKVKVSKFKERDYMKFKFKDGTEVKYSAKAR